MKTILLFAAAAVLIYDGFVNRNIASATALGLLSWTVLLDALIEGETACKREP